MGRVNGGWFLVVGMLVGLCFVCGDGLPTCGMLAVRAMWSLYVVFLGVIYMRCHRWCRRCGWEGGGANGLVVNLWV